MEKLVRLRGPTGAYAAAVLMVAAATACALLAARLLAPRDLAVVFVLPVLAAGLRFGRWPAVTTAALSVLADDLFLIEPRLSLTVASRADLWTLVLLLVVGLIASEVASRTRRRALDAERDQTRGRALLALAEQVLAGDEATIHRTAAEALLRICGAPAMIVGQPGGDVRVLAGAGDPSFERSDSEAAVWALENGRPSHAQSFPFDASSFDIWPVRLWSGGELGLAVLNADGDPLLRQEREPLAHMVAALLAGGGPRRAEAVSA